MVPTSKSAEKGPAVDLDDRAGHVGGGIGGKEEERRVEVGKASKAALGDALDHGLAGIGLEEAGVEVGADIAGRQRIDADPEAREFERSEEHTSELQSLMRISYAVFCLKNKKQRRTRPTYCT